MNNEYVKKENILKRWYKLCEPDKKLWFLQMLFYVLYASLSACMTIFAAKTINCLYNQDWTGAFIWLGVELADIIIRNIFSHMEWMTYDKHYGVIRKNITAKIYDKIFKMDEKSLKKFSSEKIINIAQNNLSDACEFCEYVSSMVAYMVQIVIAIVAIFSANLYAGLAIGALCVVNYFVYSVLNKKMGRALNARHEAKDKSFQDYSRIIEGKSVIAEMNAKEDYEKILLSDIDTFNSHYTKYNKAYSFRENLYYAMWNVVVYAIAAVLIFLLSKDMFDIALYLVIVPYLTSCTDKFCTLYAKLGGIELMRVDVDRINMILSLNNKEMIQYGSINTQTQGYNLGLANVSLTDKELGISLKQVDMSFCMHGVNIVKGDRGCGKRAIFDILRRHSRPQEGVVLLDNLNLYDYNEKTFKNHIDYCAAHPVFVNGTVRENLLMANKDFNFVQAHIKDLGLEKVIQSLPNGYDTRIDDIKSGETRFWIGLIRATLSRCKVLMIYEYPEAVSGNFHTRLQKIVATSEPNKRTLILFTHKDDYDDYASAIFQIKNGKVRQVKGKRKSVASR